MTATFSLILKRAAASRTSGEWREDDYDVAVDDIVVDRIMKATAAPEGTPWFWTWPMGAPDIDPRLRGDSRGGHDGIRDELATGIAR
jgi:hypothetical protein